MTDNGYEISFGGDENILKFIVVTVHNFEYKRH